MNIAKTTSKPLETDSLKFPFIKCGDQVVKEGGDYIFKGIVVGILCKLNKTQHRVVVENCDGILHIFNPMQLKRYDQRTTTS